MAQIKTLFNQDINEPVKVRYIDGNVFSSDNKGNIIGVNVFDNGEAVTLTGTISANIIRADGATVAQSGSISENTAYVELPQSAYAVPGVISIVIKATNGSVITTLCAVVANVYQSTTDTVVDPGTIIPDISALITEIETAVASIPADYSSLWASIAPAFSADRAYSVGEYTTYDGKLYRFNNAHSGNWSSDDVRQIDIGNQIYTIRKSINDSDVFITPEWSRGTITNAGADANSTTRLRTCFYKVRDNIYVSINSGYAVEVDWYNLSDGTEFLGNTGWLTENQYVFKAGATHFRLLMKNSAGTAIYPYEGVNASVNFNAVANGLNSLDTNYYLAHIPDSDNGQIYPDDSTAKTKIIPIKPGHIYDIFVHGGNRRVFGLSNNPAPVIGEVMPLAAYYLSNTTIDIIFRFTNSGNYKYLYAYYQYGTFTGDPYEIELHDISELDYSVINTFKGWAFNDSEGKVYHENDVEMCVVPVQKNTDYVVTVTGGNRRRFALSNEPYPIEDHYANRFYGVSSSADTAVSFNSGDYHYLYVYYYTNTVAQTIAASVVVEATEGANTIPESFTGSAQATQGNNVGDTLSIMTYNVYTYQVSTGSESGMPDGKILNFRKFIGKTNPDIICLQECGPYIDTSSSKGCQEYLFLPAYPNIFKRNAWGYADNVTLGKMPGTNTGSVLMSQYGSGSRSIRYVVFEIGSKKLLVLNTHTSWKDGGGSPTSDGEIAIRLSNFNDVFNWENGSITLSNMTETQQITVPTHTHCIICMDGNTVTSADKTNIANVASANNFVLGNGGRFGWFYTCDIGSGSDASLDNIIVSNNIIINNIEALSSQFGNLYSDHVPLLANVTLL